MKYLLTLLFSSYCFLALGQGKYDKIFNQALAEKTTDFFYKEFPNIVGLGTTPVPYGSIATLDLGESELEFNISQQIKKKGIITYSFKGSSSGKVLPIFKGSEFNSGLSMGINYSWLPDPVSVGAIQYDNEEKAAWVLGRLKTDSGKEELALKLKSFDLHSADLKQKIAGLKTDRNRKKTKFQQSNSKADKLAFFKADSILIVKEAQLEKLNVEKSLQFDISNKMDNDFNSKEILKSLKVPKYSFDWYSLSASTEYGTFNLIELKDSSNYSMSEKKSVELSIEAYHNHLKKEAKLTSYHSYGIKFDYTNNFDELTKRKVQDIQNIIVNDSLPRTLFSEKTAYLGEYKTKQIHLTVKSDHFWFIKNDVLGFHVYPSIKLINGFKTALLNLGTGIVLNHRNSEDKTKIISAEVYFEANDLVDTLNAGNDFGDRISFGLRFGLPFTIK